MMRRTAPSSLDKLKPVFGWWALDPEGPALVNTSSGQRIRYVGPVHTLHPSGGAWHRFNYEDDEVSYPVLLQIQTAENKDNLRRKPRSEFLQVLRIDHNISAETWRMERNSDENVPDYGLWRRVDDCITDAFACWSDLPGHDVQPEAVLVGGGWLNSAWRVPFSRSIEVPPFKDINKPVESRWRFHTANYPFIIPLNTPVPSPWRFHHFPIGGDVPSTDISNNVRLLNAVWRKQELPFLIVPAGKPLTGLEGVTAYLRSEDGERVFFPMNGQSGTGHGSLRGFGLQIIDQEFAANLRGKNASLSRLSHWIFHLNLVYGAYRDSGKQGDLSYSSIDRAGPRALSHALWRHLSWAIFDGWLQWEGTSARSPAWDTNVALSASDVVQVSPNYYGGLWIAAATIARTGDW